MKLGNELRKIVKFRFKMRLSPQIGLVTAPPQSKYR